jgi:hypothetical protein
MFPRHSRSLKVSLHLNGLPCIDCISSCSNRRAPFARGGGSWWECVKRMTRRNDWESFFTVTVREPLDHWQDPLGLVALTDMVVAVALGPFRRTLESACKISRTSSMTSHTVYACKWPGPRLGGNCKNVRSEKFVFAAASASCRPYSENPWLDVSKQEEEVVTMEDDDMIRFFFVCRVLLQCRPGYNFWFIMISKRLS